ncbi:hypothetical protein [Anatilimnocola floriformis]|uniref:hypothetical protein n=1 Tax=Anatilimnocola floriformis TaxID=2948575 RepID=UPI0020C4D225|nr:hypothetical protein [Anatilimnocola floriformis]
MKLLIHCDEVFDILTRGPFPSGHESDPAVEHHLRSCHDCRQLAEALRPAVELFHECLSKEEVADLPEYHGDVTPMTQPFTRRLPQTMAEVQLPSENTPRHDHPTAQRWMMFLQGAIAMALTIVVVMLVMSFGNSSRNMKNGSGGGERIVTVPTANTSAEAARQLLALKLPAACWLDQNFPRTRHTGPIAQQIAEALDMHEIACCTRCHKENRSHSPSMTQVATLQQSCLICHKG